MRILAIETSCDETAIAILEITGPKEKPEVKVLANALYSQAKLHAPYGGVYPNLAKREHEKNLPILLEQIVKETSLDPATIDRIAVTVGPGLEPALWTGITFAQDLGKKWNKPVVGVNHMEGHVWSILFRESPISKSEFLISNEIQLPALALLVSGGHTELVYVKGFGGYEILGRTLDDAAGEAFDKAARMLGLPYPGGTEISKLAQAARDKNITPGFKLPRPMLHSGDFNFSFSGLKTAVLYKIRDEKRNDPEFKMEMAREFEDAVMEVLVEKTKRAVEESGNIRTIIVAGGVSASSYLRSQFEVLARDLNIKLLIPDRDLATDNAVMIGLAAYTGKIRTDLRAQGNLAISS